MTDRFTAGPIIAVVGAVGGCLVGPHLGRAAVTFAVLGAFAAVVLTSSRIGRGASAAVVVAVVLVAAIASGRAHDGVRRSPLAGAVERGATLVLSGRAVDDADSVRFSSAVLVRVAVANARRTVLVRASGSDAGRLARVRAGDRLVVRGRLGPLREWGDRRARLRHAVARVESAELLALAPPRGPRALVEALRARMLRGVGALAPGHRGLLAGFLLGETGEIPPATISAFRAAGLSHLLAVSGANVAFVLAVFAPILRRFGLGGRTVAALVVVGAFAVMTRGEPSVLRASALAAGSLLATSVGRPTARIRLLAYGVIALLVADPFLVRSPGFWLSVGASGGIICWAPLIERRLRGPAPLRSALAVSLAAQAGVAPVLIAVSGSIPIAAPLVNVLVAPAAETLGTLGLVLALAAGFVPPLGSVAGPFVGVLLAWVDGAARVGSAVPLTIGRRGAVVVAGFVAVGGIGASIACRRGSRAVPGAPPR